MTRGRRHLTFALLALALAGCSNKPGDADALRLFEEDNRRLKVDDLFAFENPRRVNGYEQGQFYVVEMGFEVVAKVDYDEAVVELASKGGGDLFLKMRADHELQVLQTEFGKFSKGQRFTKKRPMALKRTEAGWALAA